MPRGFAALVALAALTGCAGAPVHGALQSWRVVLREEPVAVVSVEGEAAEPGNVVEVEVRGDEGQVTLWRRGLVTLEPLRQDVGGLSLRFGVKDVAEVAPLGRALAAGRYAEVVRALDRAGLTQRDDLALGLLATTSDGLLNTVRESTEGRALVIRLFDELTAGHLGEDEERQAARVLKLLAQRPGPEALARAVSSGRLRTFPVRKFGVTVADAVSPSVTLGARGGLEVRYPSRAARYPEGLWIGADAIPVDEDEWVAVRLHDEGGVVRYVPALFLVQVENAESQAVLAKCLEMVSLGAAAGIGGGAGAAVTAWGWVDRAALALGLVLSTVSEHRGWILERYGAPGARFVFAAEVMNSLVGFYGLARVVTAVPRVIAALRDSYRELRAAQEALALSSEEWAIAGVLRRNTEALLQQVDEVEKAAPVLAEVIPIGRGRKPPSPAAPSQAAPVFEEEVLRATGTEGRLVPIRRGGEERLRVVAMGEGPRASSPTVAGSGGVTLEPTSPAASAANAQRLKQGLTLEEASAVFTADGRLHPEVVEIAVEVVPGKNLRNRELVSHLTRDGSAIEEWGKYSTRQYARPGGGHFEVHFYRNRKTGVIDYERDFKVILAP